jgi:hypothetical protein
MDGIRGLDDRFHESCHFGGIHSGFLIRRFKSEVQQGSIDGMAE